MRAVSFVSTELARSFRAFACSLLDVCGGFGASGMGGGIQGIVMGRRGLASICCCSQGWNPSIKEAKFKGPELGLMFNESGMSCVTSGAVCPEGVFVSPEPLPWGRCMATSGCLRFLEPGALLLWLEGSPRSVGEMDPPPGGWSTPLDIPGSTAQGPEHGDVEHGTTTRGSVHMFTCVCGAPN